MANILLLAGFAPLLANPAVQYEPEFSDRTRAVYEAHEDAPAAELTAALEGLAAEGDLTAIELLGEIYGLGLLGGTRDPTRACDLFERAAPQRPDSAHNFATCLFTGEGRPRDHAKAREWYARAAAGGWITANCGLGNMLIRGEGGERDAATGVALCRIAAERGDRDAQTDLGGYLLTGQGVERDAVAARGWLEQAAAQGQANGAFLLAQIYLKGDGVGEDRTVARRWFEAAHAGGRPDAAFWVMQTIVAGMINGEGADRTIDRSWLPEAIHWAEIAAERDPDAAKRAKTAELLPSLREMAAGVTGK